jgi:signal transduction histidine kinase
MVVGAHVNPSTPRSTDLSAAVLRERIANLPPPADWSAASRVDLDFGVDVARAVVSLFGRRTCVQTRLINHDHWNHAIADMAAAEKVNEALGFRFDRNHIRAGALLRDVGKLVLGNFFPRAYARVLRDDAREKPIFDRERSTLGTDHAEAGGLLLSRWCLPDAVVEAAARHHAPAEMLHAISQHAEFVSVIQLAATLARSPSDTDAISDLSTRLGISSRVCDEIVAGLEHHTACASRSVGCAIRSARPASPITAVPEPTTTPGTSCQSHEDVCRSIAVRWMAATNTQSCVVFVTNDARTLYHCAAADGGETTTAVMGKHQERSPCSATQAAEASTGLFLAPPPLLARPVRERFRGVLTSGPHAMMPIRCEGRIQGGVLFALTPSSIHLVTDQQQELAALEHAFAADVAGFEERLRLDQAATALLAAHHATGKQKSESRDDRSLSLMAEMAAGAAHELNTPLAVISGRAQMLARRAPNDDDRRVLDTIREQSETCANIVSDLMAVAKPDPPKPVLTALGPHLARVRHRWERRFAERNARIEVHLSDATIGAWVDPDQLTKVLDALIENALDALSDRNENGQVMINSRSHASDETVVIEVKDNGCGMTTDVLERACDPFFSHQRAGRKRGLGLSTAQRLIEINSGRLTIESSSDTGTTALVELTGRAPANREHNG